MLNEITVTILTKNSSKYLDECLKSLQKFNEIVVLDNGSIDNTMQIAKKYSNVKVFENDFIGFGPLKNLAISYASNDWILSVDSDEIFTKELIDEIENLKLDKEHIYSIKRHNYYKEKLINACGWQNDYVLRLFNRQHTTFDNKQVHESVIINKTSKVVKLDAFFKHYSFSNTQELLEKLQKYSTLWAEQNKNKRKSTPSKAFFRGVFAFIKNYFLKKGFMYGYEGLLISISNANGVFYKYIKLYEMNKYDN